MGLDHGVGHPQLSLDHATALRHLRQGACEDSDVMLRSHKWLRQYVRPMLSLLGLCMARSNGRIHSLGHFHIGEVAHCEWALPPNIGEWPTGTYRFTATRPRRSQRQSNFCCSEMGFGSWRWPSFVPAFRSPTLAGSLAPRLVQFFDAAFRVTKHVGTHSSLLRPLRLAAVARWQESSMSVAAGGGGHSRGGA